MPSYLTERKRIGIRIDTDKGQKVSVAVLYIYLMAKGRKPS
jgi:hypothetical protein